MRPAASVTSASATTSALTIPPPNDASTVGFGSVTATASCPDVVTAGLPIVSNTWLSATATVYGPLSDASHDPPGAANVYVAVRLVESAAGVTVALLTATGPPGPVIVTSSVPIDAAFTLSLSV